MRVGTKSLLWGSHQFLLHPLMVALGWRAAWGSWPRGWRLWLAFLVHDWGYWGLPNMDGDEGQFHPVKGANIMWRLCDRRAPHLGPGPPGGKGTWWTFTAYHSRYYAAKMGQEVSPLMVADKLATALLPWWLYLALIVASGEADEYMAYARSKGHDFGPTARAYARWQLRDWREQFHPKHRGIN